MSPQISYYAGEMTLIPETAIHLAATSSDYSTGPSAALVSWLAGGYFFSLEGVRGSADRPALGHRRPLSSLGRRTLFRTEPEQLPGSTKPASGKDGPTVRREVLVEQHGIYVGIDVAKARVDVAIRSGGDRREVSND